MELQLSGVARAPAAALLATLGACGAGPPADPAGPACDPPLGGELSAELLPGPPASEDFTFDQEGRLLALQANQSLVTVVRGKPPALLQPNVVVTGRGLRVLPDGQIVIADRDRSLLVRVAADGSVHRLTTTITNPNGVALGPDGQLYVSNFGGGGEVYRVDPASGQAQIVARPAEGSNGLAFSADGRTLFVGDHDAGVVYRIRDGGPPERWAEGLVRPDGLATDACGNLYAASWDRKLYRVDPTGRVQVLASFAGAVSAVAFGSGRQGWDDRRLYVMAIEQGGVYETAPLAAPAAP